MKLGWCYFILGKGLVNVKIPSSNFGFNYIIILRPIFIVYLNGNQLNLESIKTPRNRLIDFMGYKLLQYRLTESKFVLPGSLGRSYSVPSDDTNMNPLPVAIRSM